MKDEKSIQNNLRNKFDELPVDDKVTHDWLVMKKALGMAMPVAALGIAMHWKALLAKKAIWVIVASIIAGGSATGLIVYLHHRDDEKPRELPAKVAPVSFAKPLKTNMHEKQTNAKRSDSLHGLLADSTAKQNDTTATVPDTIVQHKQEPIKIGKTIRQNTDTIKSAPKHKAIINHQNNVPPRVKKKNGDNDDTLGKAKNKPDTLTLQRSLKKHPRQPLAAPDSVPRKHKKAPIN